MANKWLFIHSFIIYFQSLAVAWPWWVTGGLDPQTLRGGPRRVLRRPMTIPPRTGVAPTARQRAIRTTREYKAWYLIFFFFFLATAVSLVLSRPEKLMIVRCILQISFLAHWSYIITRWFLSSAADRTGAMLGGVKSQEHEAQEAEDWIRIQA